jgi:hypothetical protein
VKQRASLSPPKYVVGPNWLNKLSFVLPLLFFIIAIISAYLHDLVVVLLLRIKNILLVRFLDEFTANNI